MKLNQTREVEIESRDHKTFPKVSAGMPYFNLEFELRYRTAQNRTLSQHLIKLISALLDQKR